MSKLNSTLHGVFDYLIVGGFFAAPVLYRLSKPHALVAQSFAWMFAITNLITKYPLSFKRIVPFPIHGIMEALAGGALFTVSVMPSKLKLNHRLFYLSSGLQLLRLVSVSDYSDESKKLELLWQDPESKKAKQDRAEAA